MPGSNVRPFRAFARLHSDEAIWFAQIVTWLPLVSQVVGVASLVFAVAAGGPLARPLVTLLPLALLSLLIACLYGLAGAWVGARYLSPVASSG